MDMNGYNGYIEGGLPYGDYPAGAGPLFTEEESASQGYESLTETEKEHLILQCKDAKTVKDKQRIMDSVSADIDAKGLAEEEAADNRYF